MNKKIIFGIVITLLIFGSAFPASAQDNASLNYVWNESCSGGDCWIPWIGNTEGKPKVDINLLNISAENASIADSVLTNYIYPKGDTFTRIINATILQDLRVLGNSYLGNITFTDNGTIPDSILTDYIYPESNVDTKLKNLTVLQDVHILGTLYGGSPLKIGGDIQLTGNLTDSVGNVIISNDATGNLTVEDSFLTDFIYSRTNPFTTIQNLSILQDITTLGNITGSDSILTDYIYSDNNPSTSIDNLTITNDIRVTGNSYLGSIVFDANGTIPDSLLTDFIYPESATVVQIKNLTVTEDITTTGNITGSDSILTDYIFTDNNAVIQLQNLTVIDDIYTAGSYYGDGSQLTGIASNPDLTNYAVLNTTVNSFSGINYFAANVSFADNLTVDGSTFYVDASSNNVGIGTTTPSSILDVSGGNLTITNETATDFPYILFSPGGYIYDNGTAIVIGHS